MFKEKSFLGTFLSSHFYWHGFSDSQLINYTCDNINSSFFRGRMRVHWLGAFSALLAVIGSLIPYLSQMLLHPEMTPEIRDERFFLFRGLIYVFPILKAIWYWVRFTSGIFPKHILQLLEFSWAGPLESLVRYVFIILKYGLGAISVIFSIKIHYRYFRDRKQLFLSRWRDLNENEFLHFYVFSAFMALLVAAAMSPIDLIYWHLIILFSCCDDPGSLFRRELSE